MALQPPLIPKRPPSPNAVSSIVSPTVNGSSVDMVDMAALDPSMPPPLVTPAKGRVVLIIAGVLLAACDLAFFPLIYYYTLNYKTGLDMQLIFAIITAVYGMICFVHYGLRSFKLFLNRHGRTYRPLGWTRWGLLEFTHINILITIALVETELIVATAPNQPILRLAAMPAPTTCLYIGFLFVLTNILHHTSTRLPFCMSSVPKGEIWRPALHAFIEDAAAIEARGHEQFRLGFQARYSSSPMFRRMILRLSWVWGVALLMIGTVCTALVMTLREEVAFGVGWGLPYICVGILAVFTVFWTMAMLKDEYKAWNGDYELAMKTRGGTSIHD